LKSGIRWLVIFVMAMAAATIALAQVQAPPAAEVTNASVGTGQLVIFNDSGKTLIPSNQKVTDNGKPIASLARQTYVKVAVPAGVHLLRPDPYLWKQQVRLDVEPGTTHYIVVAYKPERSWALPAAGAPLLLQEISEAEAAPLLSDMKER
jgi:hypothetical protein